MNAARHGGGTVGHQSGQRSTSAAGFSYGERSGSTSPSLESFPPRSLFLDSAHSEYSRQQRERARVNMSDDQSDTPGGASTCAGIRGLESSGGRRDTEIYALRRDPKYPDTYRREKFQPAPVLTMKVASLVIGYGTICVNFELRLDFLYF